MFIQNSDASFKNTRRSLLIQLAHKKHVNTSHFLEKHCITEVAQVIDTHGLPFYWAISLKSDPMEYHIVQKSEVLNFDMWGDHELIIRSSSGKNQKTSMHIEQFYKWAQTLEKPHLEFLPKDLENLVHSYLSPTIADGMQHLALKYGLEKKKSSEKKICPISKKQKTK